MFSKVTSVEINIASGREEKNGIMMASVKVQMIVSFTKLSQQFCPGL